MVNCFCTILYSVLEILNSLKLQTRQRTNVITNLYFYAFTYNVQTNKKAINKMCYIAELLLRLSVAINVTYLFLDCG